MSKLIEMKKSIIVFIVTSGEYSDYHIDAIFSTETLAKEWIARKEAYDEDDYEGRFKVEPWNLDREREAVAMPIWQCAPFAGDECQIECHTVKIAVKIPLYQYREVNWVESGVSAEHCLKLAVESRQLWLRNKASLESGAEFDVQED